MEIAIVGLLGLGLGIGVSVAFAWMTTASRLQAAQAQVAQITHEAQLKAETFLGDARLKAKELEDAGRQLVDREAQERRRQLDEQDDKLSQRDGRLEQKGEDLQRWEQRLESAQKAHEQRGKDLEALVDQQRKELERVGGLPAAVAREQLLTKVQADLEQDIARRVKDNEAKVKEESKRRAAKVLAQACQRCVVDFTTEALVTVVPLPSDEMKGRIIGREGRNIRAFETLTGVDVIVDDTPEAIVLSGFNSIKREIARMTMEKMIIDGRIHPAKIEQVYEQCQKELHQTIREIGEDAVMKMGLTGISEKMLFEVGKLRYRTSYGQNLLEHSMEVAKLAGTIAEEIGANVSLATRAGFLHDIGKVASDDMEGPHAVIGGEIAARMGERPDVCNAIAAHHEDVEQQTVEATIVQIADALSAGRPGARRSTLESYIKRLENLEGIARDFKGVSHAYAIQAGREIRVIVRPGEVDDIGCAKMAVDLARKIETEMEYPGQVKVVVMRETRAIDVAK